MRAAAAIAFALSAAACGRIGFDTGEDGVHPDIDLGCTPAAETCNGIDDDCDGRVDPGCPCVEFQVAAPDVRATTLSVAWTGTELAVPVPLPTQRILMFGVDGTATGEIAIALASPSLLWDGTSFVAAGRVEQSVRLVRFDRAGTILDEEFVPAAGTIASLHLAPAGRGFDLVWEEILEGVVHDAHAQWFDAALVPRGPRYDIGPYQGYVDGIARTEPLAAVWSGFIDDQQTVWASRVDGAPFLSTPGYDSTISAGPSGFLVAARTTSGVTLSRADRAGVPFGSPVVLPGVLAGMLASHWRGDRHAIVIVGGNSTGTDFKVIARDVDEAGTVLASYDDIVSIPIITQGGAFARPGVYIDDVRIVLAGDHYEGPYFAQACR